MGTNITAFRLVDPNNLLVKEVVTCKVGTNITAFRLVDLNNPLVQEVLRWVPTSLPSVWWILTTLYCCTGGCKVGTNITAFSLVDPITTL